ncbi:MAG: TlpA disulfide reductase family protein [Chloroflexota bacterium]
MGNRLSWRSLTVWGIVAFLLVILGLGLLDSSATRPEAGAEAPTFDMTFFNGYEWETTTQANLSELQGNVVVLNFWASWCVECRLEADSLQATAEKYADEDVIFLGIAWTDTAPKSFEYMDEFKITYPNAPDIGLEIGEKYEITGIPETFFIDKNGQIAQVVIGPVDDEILDGVITALLEN